MSQHGLYQPRIADEHIRQLYQWAKRLEMPMTRLVNALLAHALARLEQGTYGNCFDCGEEIAEKRLRALPFAVRCKDCEEARENAEQRERQVAARRGSSSLFFDM